MSAEYITVCACVCVLFIPMDPANVERLSNLHVCTGKSRVVATSYFSIWTISLADMQDS